MLIFANIFAAVIFLFSSVVFATAQAATVRAVVAQTLTESQVRVRLLSESAELDVSGREFKVSGARSVGDIQTVAIPQAEELSVMRAQIRGRWVWITKVVSPHMQGAHEKIFTDKILKISGLNISHRHSNWPDAIYLLPSKQNAKFNTVSTISLEKYVYGVVASEMPVQWPIEALKAQAIAARSYALNFMRAKKRSLWDVENSILDQVYNHHQISKHDRVWQAVEETQGVVLETKSNKILRAYYHSDCGGHTISSHAAWGVGSKEGAVKDEACPLNPKANWQYKISAQELDQKLADKITRETTVSQNEIVHPFEVLKDEGGHVHAIQIKLKNGSVEKISGEEIRRLLGFSEIRSTLFELSQSETEVVFSGRGFGHGVGMCQWGSRHLAEAGQSYRQILQHYYPMASLKFPPKL